jgi:ribosomal protein S18 acetylase RimI-like enzyme
MAVAAKIRRALPDDRAAVLETVTAAFRHDPAWAFLTDGRYQQVAPLFVAALFDARVDTGNVWVSDDLAAVAMWKAPDKREEPDDRSDEIFSRYRAAVGAGAARRLAAYDGAIAAASPSSPHWYLGTLATHPARQREGLATAVIDPVIGEADRDGVACCLETSTEANRRFYERRGFAYVTELVVAGGPPTWWLRRAAPKLSP